MATDKRSAHIQAASLGYGAPVTIQLSATSANDGGGGTSVASAHQRVIDQNNNSSYCPTLNDRQPAIQEAPLPTDQPPSYCHDSSRSYSQSRSLSHSYGRPHSNMHSHNNRHGGRNNLHHHQLASRSLLHPDSASGSSSGADSDEAPTPPPNYHEIPGIVPAHQGRSSGPPPSYDEVVNPNASPPTYQSLFGQVREARKTSNGLVDLFRQLFLILIGTLGCTMIIGFLLLIPITMILVGIVYVNECRAENIPSFLVIGGLVWIVKNILNCYNQFKKDSSIANRPPPRRTPRSSSGSAIGGRLGAANSSTNVLIVNHQTHTVTLTDDNNNISSPATQGQIQTQQSQPTANTNPVGETQSNPTLTRPAGSQYQQQLNVNRIRPPSLIGITSFKCEYMLNYFLLVWFLAGCIVVYRIYEPDYDNPLSSSYCNRTVYLYAFWLMTSTFIVMAIVLSCLCCLMASSLMSCNHGR